MFAALLTMMRDANVMKALGVRGSPLRSCVQSVAQVSLNKSSRSML